MRTDRVRGWEAEGEQRVRGREEAEIGGTVCRMNTEDCLRIRRRGNDRELEE